MKRQIRFALVAGLVIYIWQFLSFAALGLHESSMAYTDKQDQLLEAIDASGLETGMYYLGRTETNSQEDMDLFKFKYEGKRFARLNLMEDNSQDMPVNLLRGFLVCLVLMFLMYYVYAQQKDASLMQRIRFSIIIGLAIFFMVPYTNFIWFPQPDIYAHLIDAIVPWTVVGFVAHKMV